METSEIKPTSRRARFWARLSDPDKWPRCWWFPPSTRRDAVRRMPEVARQGYRALVQQRHEKLSETIRLAMLSLLGFALFCLLIILSAPDSSILVADPTVKMPFADVQVSFYYFLFLAPFLLIIMTVYLHIFYGYWLDVETDYQHLTCSREPSGPFIMQVPTLFSLNNPVSRRLTTFIFYWLVPLVLGAIAWKASIRLAWGCPLVVITGLIAVVLFFLRIRRCPTSQRKWNRPYWVVMVLIVVGIVGIMFNPEKLERQLNIFRADLKGKWLGGADLHDAYGPMVNFEGAELPFANLQSTNLIGAKLKDANLVLANLKGAQLQG